MVVIPETVEQIFIRPFCHLQIRGILINAERVGVSPKNAGRQQRTPIRVRFDAQVVRDLTKKSAALMIDRVFDPER